MRQNIILYLKYVDPSGLRVYVPSLMDGHWSKKFVSKNLDKLSKMMLIKLSFDTPCQGYLYTLGLGSTPLDYRAAPR